MRPHILAVGVLATMLVSSACEGPGPNEPAMPGQVLSALGPADGNGNKEVVRIDERFPGFTTCATGETLDLHIVGWIQVREVSQVPMAILPAHFDFIYSNAAGETYVWRQVALQRFYFNDDGDLMMAVTGRLGYDGNIGRLVVNLTTGTVEQLVGKEAFAEDLACAALT